MVVIRGVAQSQARSSWRIHTGSVSHQLCGEEPGSFCQLQISQNRPTSPSKHKFPPPKIPAISGSVSYMRKFLSNIKKMRVLLQNCCLSKIVIILHFTSGISLDWEPLFLIAIKL